MYLLIHKNADLFYYYNLNLKQLSIADSMTSPAFTSAQNYSKPRTVKTRCQQLNSLNNTI